VSAVERSGASPGFVVFTILGLIGLIAVVALLIPSYPTDVEAVSTPVAVAAPSESALPATGVAPVGGVATGGGGTAGDSGGRIVVPVVTALAALTLLAVAGTGLRHREA